jgi:hypothetical protein
MSTTEANPLNTVTSHTAPRQEPVSALDTAQAAALRTTGSAPSPTAIPNPRTASAPANNRQNGQLGSYADYVEDILRRQLSEFEHNYLKLDLARCQVGFQHFQAIIEQVDQQYDSNRAQVSNDLTALQVETIGAMNYSRALSEKIDGYLKATVEQPRVENITYQILNGGKSQQERAALLAALNNYPQLTVLLQDYQQAATVADENLARFTQLQNRLVELANLRTTVRVMISQTYARLGHLDRAGKLKSEVNRLGGPTRSFDHELARRSDISFNQRFTELLAFKEIYGHCDVPKRYRTNRVLAAWVSNLRSRRKRGSLSQEKIDILDKVGFCWTSTRSQWESRLSDLAHFIKEHGHSFVPQFYARSPYLGTWVRNLRKECRRNAICAEKIEQLKAIGFNFEVLDHRWSDKLEQLSKFKERTGHCRVPHYWPENPSLARWVNIQREQKRKNQISAQRLTMLEALGFDWEPPKGRPPKQVSNAG